jgi:hypothetical protein
MSHDEIAPKVVIKALPDGLRLYVYPTASRGPVAGMLLKHRDLAEVMRVLGVEYSA